MIRNAFFAIGIALFLGLGARSAPAAPTSTAAGIECGQWTAPVKLAGKKISTGPYASKAAAQAAAANQQTQINAIANGLWPFFSCPGCPKGVPGCWEKLQVIEATTGTGAIRETDAGWYIDYFFTGGLVAMSCDSCPDVGGIG